ncbi:hypothetical protein HH214_18780 [Mucilaginibacter robiniae]|uniref:Uncharacterized protein n=1 Tax=Mucilaginibacter robiniae TaxID=2728022 RepID=A0A7L5E7I2_9SPHI|nr:hypothetical protein [Mucilaginibacter robiniae]QJD97774.1 hypothetical protein HH214_18780 [Mucilaginibacter robiniae]
MIIYFSAGLIAIVFIICYLNKQEQNVTQILKQNKNVVPLYKLRASRQKAEVISNKTTAQQASSRQVSIKSSLNNLNKAISKKGTASDDYLSKLDRLSRQI